MLGDQPGECRLTVNMAPGATEVSRSVFDLHMTIFWICVVIGVLVFGAMFWSMIVHRRSTGQQPAHFHESTTVEILWTVVPFVILVVMAVPATRTLIHIYDTSEPELDVQVTGYQWKWQYKYLGQDVEYFSNLATPQDQIHNRQAKDEHYLLEVDEPLVLPVGTKVRFLITSSDVIHSWWVPACGQARRHPRLRQRGLDQGRRARHLSWPVRRAVRQGPRLHADRGRRQAQGRVRPVAGQAQGRGGEGQGTDQQASGPRKSWLRAATRSTTPSAPPATRPKARACRRCSRR